MESMSYLSVFKSQQTYFLSQRTKDISFRKENLLKLKNLIKDNEDKFYEAIYEDFGKSEFDTYTTELSLIYGEIDYFLKHLSQLCRPQRVRTNLLNMPGKSHIYYEPLGCILIIGAWNYPYHLTLIPLISAMAAGNTCMVKPGEASENTMKLMADLINTQFPSEYLYVVQGGVEETTELLSYPYNKIFFTGSPKVGRVVYEAAAKNMIPVTLELGGKSPVIVCKSANLRNAAKRIVWAKFLNGGQTCVAPDYILTERKIKDELLSLIKEHIVSSKYEDGAEHYVRIINKRNFDRIIKLIEPSKIFYGGCYNESSLYIQPTVLDNVCWDDAVMQEEIFGPLLPVLCFDDYEETLNHIATLEKPLSAYLFTNDDKQKEQFLSLLSFGGGCINDVMMHLANPHLPFGGVGNSGMGSYHEKYGFMTFSHQKSIVERIGSIESDMKYPPYSNNKKKWIRKIL
jgi:aldehyde dehydrogenase (NAD+)